MKIQNLEDLSAFLQVAETGGFSGAARRLQVPVSVVSKRVARLEAALGQRLFQRSTRAVNLTEEGKGLVPKVQRLFGDLREMEEQFANSQDLKGPIRLTMPWGLSQGPVAKILTEFRKKHPLVEVQVHFSDALEKLVEGGFDLAIRFSTMEDSSMVARRLGPNYLKMVATPAYLKKHGTPKTVKDLKAHPLLMIPQHRMRKFQKSGVTLNELQSTPSVITNNGLFLVEIAKAGGGIAIRSHWDVVDLLKRKELVEVVVNDRLESSNDAYIVTPSNRYMSPRVRALMDALVEEFPKFLKTEPN
ncbi:LysR family transcriptional regulator [Bdellovibrio svalbardensis]|uniref:LysR family transcriptional regulator n=1 Tax=Bdellovibrio svalbardensis TaxID=2972972 RepID=A0ABT6DG92_9BACT|nr:LysR family transcriptional regulator [Bdellovibrio svalbardensis]MDG0815879.1 LysR family transcriptional regulator [Bdellovibrio svalbardensis]